jgi:sterol desaturase/sphingolipid hydroxylase (fatty acid hydroxylase superfamily)
MRATEQFYRFRSFWIFPALAVTLMILSDRAEPERGAGSFVLPAALGLVFWTLLEYGLHRFAFHREAHDTPVGKILTGSHLSHHRAPRDPDKVLVHTSFAIPVSIVLFVAIYAMTGSLYLTSAALTGIWAGFLYYEFVHYRVHCTASNAGLISAQRRRHFHHHFSRADKCFGVTSPLWDIIFRTL